MKDPIVPATEENIQKAAQLLQRGEICAFPTETVYGLGANAFSESAILRIYQEKGRPSTNPLIVHLPNLEAAKSITSSLPDLAYQLATHFWPGPLTLVLPRNQKIPDIVSAGLPTVAIRVPAHKVALRLLQRSQLPICAPSANRSEQLSPTTANHVRQSLPGLPMILDGGPCQFGIESTIVDLTVHPPRLLRPGALPLLDLMKKMGTLVVPTTLESLQKELPRAAPGMMARHYAPKAKLVLCESLDQIEPDQYQSPLGILLREERMSPNISSLWPNAFVETLPSDPVGYAADLFAALHRLDDHLVRTILVETPPQDLSWLAISDRLLRAATP